MKMEKILSLLKKGKVFTEENIRSIRPGYGFSPEYLNEAIGKQASSNIKKRNPIRLRLVGK